MSWSEAFREEIRKRNRRRHPRYVVESYPDPNFNPLGGTLRLSSHDEGPYYSRVISSTGHAIDPGEVIPGEWSTVQSSARIGVTPAADFRRQIRKGQLVQVRMGFSGWAENDYQTIYAGHVQDVGRSGGQWYLALRGLVAALASPFHGDATDPTRFETYPVDTPLGLNYTVGDGTITVTSTFGAERESTGNYIIRLNPAGSPSFYVVATGATATTFTGCTTGYLGTTAANTLAGTTVNVGWLVEAHPVDATRKLIASTGSIGSNGIYDTLPTSWGLGFPDAFLDHDDMDATKTQLNPGGGSTWMVHGEDSTLDLMSEIAGMLRPAGAYLTEHQGKLTIRFGSALGDDFLERRTITDADILEIESYNSYAGNFPVEYAFFRSRAASGHTDTLTEDTTSRPSQARYDPGSLLHISANGLNWVQFLSARLGPWKTRVPEGVSLVLAGWAFADMSAGQLCYLYSKSFTPRGGDVDVPWYVTSVQPDWFGATTRVTLVHLPEDETAV